MCGNVEITQERYEELLDDETRIDVLCELLVEKDLSVEMIFSILGESCLIEKYKNRLSKEQTELQKWIKERDGVDSD